MKSIAAMSGSSTNDQQKAVLFHEIMEISAEQKALQRKNTLLQQRLEELLLTLELKVTSEASVSTPQKLSPLVPSMTDDDDLDAAPIGWPERGVGGDGDDTFTTESGWDRDTATSTDSLSLSYSFSPATQHGSTAGRSLISSDGLSPAPISGRPQPGSTSKPLTPALPRSAMKKQQAEARPEARPGDWSQADTGVPGFVIGAANSFVGLFGGSPSKKQEAERPKPRSRGQLDSEATDSDASTVQANRSEEEPEEDEEEAAAGKEEETDDKKESKEEAKEKEVTEEEKEEEKTEEAASEGDDEDDQDDDENEQDDDDEVLDDEGLEAKEDPLSAEEIAAREAQAQAMSMSALSQALQAHLSAAGKGDHARGLKETIEEACALLGLPFSGVLKKDATTCYVRAGARSAPSSAPAKPASSPVSRPRPAATFLTAEPEPESSAPRTPGKPSASASASSSPSSGASVVTPTAAPQNPAAYAIFSPTNPTLTAARQAFIGRLQTFYAAHNPAKVDQVQEILEKFAGKEDELVARLENMYKVKFPPK